MRGILRCLVRGLGGALGRGAIATCLPRHRCAVTSRRRRIRSIAHGRRALLLRSCHRAAPEPVEARSVAADRGDRRPQPGDSTTVFWMDGRVARLPCFNGAEITTAALLLLRLSTAARQPGPMRSSCSRPVGCGSSAQPSDGGAHRAASASPWLGCASCSRSGKGRVPGLFLCAQGAREEVAASLGEAEKLDLAGALRQALRAWRSPAV